MQARTIVAADTAIRRRLTTEKSPRTPSVIAHANSPMPEAGVADGPPPALPVAVVDIVTVTGVAELPEIMTDAGALHIGAGVAGGETLHVRLTVPLNDPDGAIAKLNVAVLPAEIVDELEPPDAIAIVKSGAAGRVVFRSTNILAELFSTTRSGLPSPFISATCITGGET
ncbi:MAG: hypothetical protein WBQ81_05820 [Candidatus Sulfotelmatobacter sp.]